MNLLGTIYAVDDEHIDVLRSNLQNTLPPAQGGRILCMDMDETSDIIEKEYPDHCIKATLLCPPPLAMYKEIDGDQEGFIKEYNEYLDWENSVQEFIASMLFFMHIGGNILLKTPASLRDDTLWMNVLITFFFTRYGITMGTGIDHPYSFDQSYDNKVADMMYKHGYTNAFDYINSVTYISPPFETYNRLMEELMMYGGPDSNPFELYTMIKNSISYTGVAIIKPALIFG